MVGRHSGGYESTVYRNKWSKGGWEGIAGGLRVLDIGISGVKDGGRGIRVGILILIRPKTFLRVICEHF